MSIFNKNFRLIFLIIFLLEIISFCSFFVPELNTVLFFVLLISTLIISLYKLEYGILILLIELFIGSKGYLFYFEHEGVIISIRIALWLVIMAVWLEKLLIGFFNERKIEIKKFVKDYDLKYLFILFAFIGWGLINGLLNSNDFSNIFFDFNGWLYFALIFPLLSIANICPGKENKAFFERFVQIFVACISWLSLKTFIVLYIFSHNFIGITEELYKWIRNSGVGEITQIQGGFYRIFFQSHIFVMVGLFIFILLFVFNSKSSTKNLNFFKNHENNFNIFYFVLTIVFFAVNIITFSRSNWLGICTGLFFLMLLLIFKRNWAMAIHTIKLLLSSTLISILVIIIIVKFPFPNPTGGFNTAELLAKRAGQITNEAGVSSRWSLLPELWEQITDKPILGKGFGSTVTYKTSDPRILSTNLTGMYTTYAFEWGWLDIWLKLGLFGLSFYLIFIFNTIYKFKKFISEYSQKNAIFIGLGIGFLALLVINIFSPYFNHPLGIGYLILINFLLNENNLKNN